MTKAILISDFISDSGNAKLGLFARALLNQTGRTLFWQEDYDSCLELISWALKSNLVKGHETSYLKAIVQNAWEIIMDKVSKEFDIMERENARWAELKRMVAKETKREIERKKKNG